MEQTKTSTFALGLNEGNHVLLTEMTSFADFQTKIQNLFCSNRETLLIERPDLENVQLTHVFVS